MTITVGTDSYIAIAEADSYFETTLKNATWAALDTAAKEIVLKMATRKLELLDYLGVKTVDTQTLEFPRSYSNSELDGTPNDIKYAQSELALWLYSNQNSKINDAKAQGITSISLGNESYSLDSSSTVQPVGSVEANEYLDKWLRKAFRVL